MFVNLEPVQIHSDFPDGHQMPLMHSLQCNTVYGSHTLYASNKLQCHEENDLTYLLYGTTAREEL